MNPIKHFLPGQAAPAGASGAWQAKGSRAVSVALVAVALVLAGTAAGAWMAGYPYPFPQHEGIVGDYQEWMAGWDSVTATTYRHPDDGRDRVVVFLYRRRDGLATTITWEPLGVRCLACPTRGVPER